jgi:putative ABC transport system permease protein
MLNALRDLAYGARALVRQPGFAVVGVLLLSLGIGLNTAIFTLVDTLVFRPLPVAQPDRLVGVFTTGEGATGAATTSYQDFKDLRAATNTLSDMVGYSLMFGSFSASGAPRLVMGEVVTANYFQAFGVPLAMGRAFRPEEEIGEGAHPVAILSDRMWRLTFGARPNVVGETFRLRNRTYQVIGVAPPSYPGLVPGIATELWIPISMVDDVSPFGNNDSVPSATGKTRLERRGARWMFVKGVLKADASPRAVEADLNSVMTRLAGEFPISNRGREARVTPSGASRLMPEVDEALRPAGVVLLLAVGLVLLVACANLAGMLLARGTARARELAVRAALGASRPRLLRLLAAENLVLALAGGAGGVLVAVWAMRLLAAFQPPIDLPLSLAVSTDARALVFAAILAVVSSAAFGLLPALRATRLDLVTALKSDGALAAAPGRRLALRHVLVVGQVTVSFVLAVGGILLMRSLQAGMGSDPGFPTRGLVQASISPETQGYTDEAADVFLKRAVDQVAQIPGVTSAALSTRMPLTLNVQTTDAVLDGQATDDPRSRYILDTAQVSERYFETLGIAILDGRNFDSRDTRESARVAIVNRALATRLWPGQRAVGQRIRLRDLKGPLVEIVGLVPDHKVRTLGEPPRPLIHFPLAQRPSGTASVVARTSGDELALTLAMERQLRALDPDLVLMELQSFSGAMATSLHGYSIGSSLFGGLALLALVLASLGLYGVVAFSVSRRTREIGIRVALGADRGTIVRAVMREGLGLVAIGAALGLILSIAGAAALRSVLLGIGVLDVVSYAAATAALIGAAALACAIPARRAAAIQPTVALRQS